MTAPTKLPAERPLLNCRCGHVPSLYFDRPRWEALCPEPDGGCGLLIAHFDQEQVVAAWNVAATQQATPPIAAPADAERERLAALCESRGNLCQRKADSARSDDAYVGTIERWQQEADDQRAIATLLRTPAPEPQPAGEVLEPGVAEIAAERRRQREVEGWTEAHDDEHTHGEMAQAAACYATPEKMFRRFRPSGKPVIPPPNALTWPWDEGWWKPKDKLRNLERAGALIAAEIARIKRAQAKRTPTRPPPRIARLPAAPKDPHQ